MQITPRPRRRKTTRLPAAVCRASHISLSLTPVLAIAVCLIVLVSCAPSPNDIPKLIHRLYWGPEIRGAGSLTVARNKADAAAAYDSLKRAGSIAVPFLTASISTDSPYLKQAHLDMRDEVFVDCVASLLGDILRSTPPSKEADDAVKALIDMLHRIDDESVASVSRSVQSGLGSMGAVSLEPIKLLLDDPTLSDFAVSTLGEIGAPAVSILPRLLSMERASNDNHRRSILRAAVTRLYAAQLLGTNEYSIQEVADCLNADAKNREPEAPVYLSNAPPVISTRDLYPWLRTRNVSIDLRKTDYAYINLPTDYWATLLRTPGSQFPILWSRLMTESGERVIVQYCLPKNNWKRQFTSTLQSEREFRASLTNMESELKVRSGEANFSLVRLVQ